MADDDALRAMIENVRALAGEVSACYDEPPNTESNEYLLAQAAEELAGLLLGQLGGKQAVAVLFLPLEGRVFTDVLFAITKTWPSLPAVGGLVTLGSHDGQTQAIAICPTDEDRLPPRKRTQSPPVCPACGVADNRRHGSGSLVCVCGHRWSPT